MSPGTRTKQAGNGIGLSASACDSDATGIHEYAKPGQPPDQQAVHHAEAG